MAQSTKLYRNADVVTNEGGLGIIDDTVKQLEDEYGQLEAEYKALMSDTSKEGMLRRDRVASRKCVIVNHLNALKRSRQVVSNDLKTAQRSPYGAVPPAPSILRG